MYTCIIFVYEQHIIYAVKEKLFIYTFRWCIQYLFTKPLFDHIVVSVAVIIHLTTISLIAHVAFPRCGNMFWVLFMPKLSVS